jgi:DNA-directed RNA polymerase sigma subunit (sigma70/sigma32)
MSKKLTEAEIPNIAKLRYEGYTLDIIAEEYGVTKQRIGQILKEIYKGKRTAKKRVFKIT